MQLAETEHTLLEDAILAFHSETGLQLNIIKKQVTIAGVQIDAVIKVPHHVGELAVVVKRWAQQANMGALADQVQRLPMAGVLVADYINPNMGKKFKAMGIQYIDTAGNAYLNLPPVYINVAGKKQRNLQTTPEEGPNRAFDTTGLKVVFGFLCDPLLAEATQREIAKRTGVALGTVGWVLSGLKNAGFIVDRGRGRERRLVNQRKLLDRWVEAYPEKLKPKQRVGDFIADEPNWWQEIEIEKYGAYWGGELAAAKYTGYLKPQTVTIYLPEGTDKKLLAKAKLRKAVERTNGGSGIVKIYRSFWPLEPKKNHEDMVSKLNYALGLVNPILVYADLIATGDSRNREAAGKIYEQFIAEHIGKD